MSQRVESVSGVLTLVVGVIAVSLIAFVPWMCSPDGESCYGLIWDSLAWLTVGVPAVCVGIVGFGGVQTGISRPLRGAMVRWLAIVGLALPTFLLVIVAQYGVILLPAFVLALWTATVGQFRSLRWGQTAAL